jgi:thiol-disulfide isomerase/thioredoxin
MKIKLTGLCSLLLFLLSACHHNDSSVATETLKDSAYAIIGKVTGQDNGIIYLIHRQSGKTDSAFLDHGFFKFSGKADTAEFCRISLNDRSKSFFLENGKISMLITKDSVRQAQITGTRLQDEFNYFQNQISRQLTDKMAELEKAYDAATKNKNQKAIDSLDKAFEALDIEQKQLVAEYTRSHPASVISAFEIYSNFLYNFRLEQLDSLYQMLDSSAKGSYFGKQILNTITKTKLTSVGSPAPDFTNNDVNGKPVSLSSFKGNYILVDFWASWCGPCRRENPAVVKAYQRFHGKGFDILGVSLDDTRADWLGAIKKDGLNWTQVSELKGWDADVVSLYGIKAIPMNFLLDKNGIIVARGLRGEELGNKLNGLLH